MVHANATILDAGTSGKTIMYSSLESCLQSLGDRAYGSDGIYCNGTFDKLLCWPAAPGGATIKQHCPSLMGLDPRKYAYRSCGENGLWEGKSPGDYSRPEGWTNYSDCYTKDTQHLLDILAHKIPLKEMKEIAYGTKIMQIIGLCLSLITLTIAIFIFCYFRSLKCNRTRIHRNLFVAIIIHVVIRLLMDIGQFIPVGVSFSTDGDNVVSNKGIFFESDIICKILIALLEYTKTVMFMWMFIEGIYLNNMIAISVFSGSPNYVRYYIMGWGFPILHSIAWVSTTAVMDTQMCWLGYTFRVYFWILEGPRFAVIAINCILLLNIIRVLVTKLRESRSTEALQVRKAVKAAIVLLPLLGITNFLSMVRAPTDDTIRLTIWSYTSHFLISFQGFFIALSYCFLNGEVQNTLRNHWERYLQRRGSYQPGRRRLSRTMSVFTSVTEMPVNCQVSSVNGNSLTRPKSITEDTL